MRCPLYGCDIQRIHSQLGPKSSDVRQMPKNLFNSGNHYSQIQFSKAFELKLVQFKVISYSGMQQIEMN